MKHWSKLRFKPKLVRKHAKKKLLESKNLIEENLTKAQKIELECKECLPIWHEKEEIIEWVKKEQSAGRIEAKSKKKKQKKIPIDQIVKLKTKLLEKEMLKDVNGLDHLVLWFENLEKKVVIFPNSFKGRWEQLNVEKEYSTKYFKQEDENPKHDKFILLGFKNLSKVKIKKTKKIKIKNTEEFELFKTEAKLLVKEQLKNFKNKDYLLLTFENIERNLLSFPNNKGKKRWDKLIENENYKISIFKRDEVEHKRDLLVYFKNIKDLKKEKLEEIEN